jgi:hypothetical protein
MAMAGDIAKPHSGAPPPLACRMFMWVLARVPGVAQKTVLPAG